MADHEPVSFINFVEYVKSESKDGDDIQDGIGEKKWPRKLELRCWAVAADADRQLLEAAAEFLEESPSDLEVMRESST